MNGLTEKLAMRIFEMDRKIEELTRERDFAHSWVIKLAEAYGCTCGECLGCKAYEIFSHLRFKDE